MNNPRNHSLFPSDLCPSCFSGSGGAQTCPVCGYTPAGESDWNRLPPGTVLRERYAVGGALGQGGFGVTYLGLDLLLHTRLAIKEYYPSGICARNPESRSVRHASRDLEEDFKKGMEKFLEEARTLARFEDHPNIVSVKDFFEENGTAYMVMNYVEGKTLGEHLKERGGRIPFDEAMGILSPLMDALDEIHASGTIHRDLSPDNIYLTRYGQPKLLDFGASKSALSMMQQRSHSVILKRGYSPPEQYQSRGRLGPWTDVYGMAATLYRCVTGEVPADAMDRIGDDPLLPPRRKGAAMSESAEAGLMRGLSFSSRNRPQSMGEFRNMLGGSEPRTPPSIPAPESLSFDTPRMESPSSEPPHEERPQPERRPLVPKGEKAFSPKLLLALLVPIAAFFLFGDGGRTLGTSRSPSQSASQSQSQSANASTTSSPSDPVLRRAQEGDADAQVAMGLRYYLGKDAQVDHVKAVEWWRKAAEQGNTNGQYLVGRMYASGEGVAKDEVKAAEWFRKAADRGHAHAQNDLGDLYYFGRGVSKDYGTAAVWFGKAAAHEHSDAQYSLGWMYEHGQGLPKDEDKAVEWYRKAAAQGHTEAQKNLDRLLAASRAQPARPTPPTPQEFIRLAGHGSAAEVKKAIESGAPLEARDEQYGGTPLMWAAAQNKDPGAISVLLSAGANVNARDSNDGTALLWAAGANRDQEVLSLLIAAGADTDARDRSGGTMRSLLERHSLVTEAQRLLNELGYEAGMVDGKAGSRTAAAVKAFQGDRGLSQDGSVSPELVAQLRRAKEHGLTAKEAPSPRPSPTLPIGLDLESLARRARQGDANAQANIARRANQGDAYAQFALAEMYRIGIGVAQDSKMALKWCRKAADQGLREAQFELGERYGFGRGVAQDDKMAAEWYRKAADQGHAYAQNNLGWMYETGRGVQKDMNKAVEWYRRAAAQGNQLAKDHLKRLGKNTAKVAPSPKPVSPKSASPRPSPTLPAGLENLVRRADQGDAETQTNLGVMYLNGRGVAKNDKTAVEWFRKAADQGHADAQARLGWMYENGRGLAQDDKMAVEWYRKAADQGDAFAQCNLGVMYENGYGVAKDMNKAVEWYRKAAAQGITLANQSLKRLGKN